MSLFVPRRPLSMSLSPKPPAKRQAVLMSSPLSLMKAIPFYRTGLRLASLASPAVEVHLASLALPAVEVHLAILASPAVELHLASLASPAVELHLLGLASLAVGLHPAHPAAVPFYLQVLNLMALMALVSRFSQLDQGSMIINQLVPTSLRRWQPYV